MDFFPMMKFKNTIIDIYSSLEKEFSIYSDIDEFKIKPFNEQTSEEKSEKNIKKEINSSKEEGNRYRARKSYWKKRGYSEDQAIELALKGPGKQRTLVRNPTANTLLFSSDQLQLTLHQSAERLSSALKKKYKIALTAKECSLLLSEIFSLEETAPKPKNSFWEYSPPEAAYVELTSHTLG